MPPVISTIPSGFHAAGSAPVVARTSRGANASPPRIISCGSLAVGAAPRHGVAVGVHEHEPVRVLDLGGAHQAPRGGRGRVAAVDRAAGQHDEPGGGRRRIVQPGPQRGERGGADLVDVAGRHGEHVRLGRGLPVRGHPGEVEQRVGGGRGDRRPAQGQRVDGGDGDAGPVGDRDRHGVRRGRREPGAHRGRARAVQRHALPGERQPAAAVAAEAGEMGGVQDGVEQRRVQAEGAGRLVAGQVHLGEDVGRRAAIRPAAPGTRGRSRSRDRRGPRRSRRAAPARRRVAATRRSNASGRGCAGRRDRGGVPGPGLLVRRCRAGRTR